MLTELKRTIPRFLPGLVIFAMVLMLLILSGCGKKGPLYLPDKTDSTTQETP